MNKNIIRRNGPCPCGSGKKYKKCCLGKIFPDKPGIFIDEIDPLIDYSTIDYGAPKLNEYFFATNDFQEFSAQRLFYTNMLIPGIEDLATNFVNDLISRGKKESMLIGNTDNPCKLVNILIQGPDSINKSQLKEKLIRYQATTIPIILEEMKKPQKDVFLEIAIEVINRTTKDYTEEIRGLIKNNLLSTYTMSLLCIYLGFYVNKESERILWNLFHYFKEYFSEETLSDGPLLGLLEMRDLKK